MWSVGVILHLLLSRKLPFKGIKISDEVINCQMHPELVGKEWESISEEAKAFLKTLMCKDPAQRISAIDALNNSWLKKYNKKKVLFNKSDMFQP